MIPRHMVDILIFLREVLPEKPKLYNYMKSNVTECRKQETNAANVKGNDVSLIFHIFINQHTYWAGAEIIFSSRY